MSTPQKTPSFASGTYIIPAISETHTFTLPFIPPLALSTSYDLWSRRYFSSTSYIWKHVNPQHLDDSGHAFSEDSRVKIMEKFLECWKGEEGLEQLTEVWDEAWSKVGFCPMEEKKRVEQQKGAKKDRPPVDGEGEGFWSSGY